MEKLIITAAICGAEVTKEQTPYIPISVNELACEAKRCADAGASIIHLHVRNPDGTPTQDKNMFNEVISEIKSVCSKNMPIIQPSTGGSVGMTWEERIQPVSLKPEMATLDCGTVNFGDDIFINGLPLMRKFAQEMIKYNVLPELECFEPGHIYNALLLKKENLLQKHMHFDLVLGVPGAISASIKNLLFLVESLPVEATWTVAGIGKHELSLGVHAILMGGHVRVGLEDNIFYSHKVLAISNAQLVDRMVRISNEIGRQIASPDEARKLLGLTN